MSRISNQVVSMVTGVSCLGAVRCTADFNISIIRVIQVSTVNSCWQNYVETLIHFPSTMHNRLVPITHKTYVCRLVHNHPISHCISRDESHLQQDSNHGDRCKLPWTQLLCCWSQPLHNQDHPGLHSQQLLTELCQTLNGDNLSGANLYNLGKASS